MPVYNCAQYLPATLDSVFAQTLREFELIAVDDGSTDNSLEVLRNYAQKEPRLRVFGRSNQLAGATRNFGLAQARGQYVGYVDSDDKIAPNMFERLYARILETDADFVMCNFEYESAGEFYTTPQSVLDERFFVRPVFKVADINFEGVKGWTPLVVVWNKLFKADFARKALHFPEGMFLEDSPAMYDALYAATKISAIPDMLYYYRVDNPIQITAAQDKRCTAVLKVIEVVFEQSRRYEDAHYRDSVRNIAFRSAFAKFKTLSRKARPSFYRAMQELLIGLDKQGYLTKGFLRNLWNKVHFIRDHSYGVYETFGALNWLFRYGLGFKWLEGRIRAFRRPRGPQAPQSASQEWFRTLSESS